MNLKPLSPTVQNGSILFLAIVAISLTVVAGCTTGDYYLSKENNYLNSEDPKEVYTSKDFKVVCLDGIEYWMRATYNRSYMSVKIDPATLVPSTCVVKVEPLTCPTQSSPVRETDK